MRFLIVSLSVGLQFRFVPEYTPGMNQGSERDTAQKRKTSCITAVVLFVVFAAIGYLT